MAKRSRKPSPLERILIDAVKASGYTQVELAARSGIQQGTLSRFLSEDLNARRTISLPIASKLCQALGLKLTHKDNLIHRRDSHA